MDGCPYDFDWGQETYIMDYYNQYNNHVMPNGVPINQEGKWIKIGLSYVGMFDEKDREEAERQRKKK